MAVLGMVSPDRWACTVLLAALLAVAPGLAPGGAAHAGAWTQSKGEGLAIVTAARRVAPVSSLAGGPIDADANITQVYLEYGLIEGLTAGGKLYVELSASDLAASSASLGGFLRKRVWRDGHGGVASVQGGYARPVESLIGQGFERADPGAVPEAHLVGLYGRGWADDWGSAFLSTGAGYHWRGEGLADEVRGELTGGYAPWRRWMGMLSLYGLYPLAGGTDASLKIVPSIAYTFEPDAEAEAGGEAEAGAEAEAARPRTIQLGLSYDVLNGGDGVGVSLSIWQPF